ncbi:MAG: 2,4-dienoyl-CoA reductase-like NADH-dependent reductase (Old Yellow Enzyme family) [Myxococcota bacterium]
MDLVDRPLTLRNGVVVPNRAILAPMTNTQSAPDGTLLEAERLWLERRAAGGYGLVSTCAAFVSLEGKAWQGQLGVSTDTHVAGLTRLAASIKAHGAVAIAQLHHGGKVAALAPGMRLSTVDEDGVRGATSADLARVAADFVAAAARCEAAGFDGVELHGANGYLFTQFLAPLDNPRTDAWGGELAGRAKLLRDTIRAVRAAVGPRFVVGVRISPVDTWTRRGLVLADAVRLAPWLADDGIDYLHLSMSAATGSPPHEDTETPVATALRQALPASVPLFAAGGVWTAADVRAAMDAGADAVATARVAIGNPMWAREVGGAGWEPARPPWTRAHLEGAAVGAAMIDYISNFPGLVVGGKPAR